MTPTEYCRTELKVPNDLRALGAVHGALVHTARHLGLSAEEEGLLVSSTEELLRSALASLAAEANLFVCIQERADRIEIELRQPGASPAPWPHIAKLAGIDSIEQEAGGGVMRLKLVKFLKGGAKPAQLRN